MAQNLENKLDSPEQTFAVICSIRIGMALVGDHPEIAEMYRGGKTHPQIAEELCIKKTYNVASWDVAKNSIGYAIRGHKGGFGIESYSGLIEDENELRRLAYSLHVKKGREGGEKVAELGVGIHGRTREEMSEQGRERAKILVNAINPDTGERYVVENGRKAVELRTGVHSPEFRRKMAHDPEFRRKIALARGQIYWRTKDEGFWLDEIECAYLLSLNPDYRRGSTVNNKKIKDELNWIYHGGQEIRSASTVKHRLIDYRKSLNN